jgi:phytoene dehydrogenase-like protein
MEVYTHTAVDPTLSDSKGRHSAALFVQWVPHRPAGSSWDVEEGPYVEKLLDIWDTFAPGVRDLVDDSLVLTPPKIEDRFGISGGHIHHVDNTFSFTDRFPYFTGVPGEPGRRRLGCVAMCQGYGCL